MRIGLALGGGGLTGGAFHAGVLSALATHGWDASEAQIVMGTSVGAITAASVRAGMPPVDMLRRHLGEPLSATGSMLLSRVASNPRPLAPPPAQRSLKPAAPDLLKALARPRGSATAGSLAAAALPEGRVSTAGIAHEIDALCANRWPEAPLWVTAMSLSDGATVVFGRPAGPPRPPLGQAVAASCAIPGYFMPVTIDGHRYVDGGTSSVCNLDAFEGRELDVVLVSAPMAIHSGLRVAADTPIRRFLRRQVMAEITRLRAAGTQVFLFAPVAGDIDAMGANPMASGREAQVARTVHLSTHTRISADSNLRQALGL